MDEYYLAHEKLINDSWNEHYNRLEDQFTGMDKYAGHTFWGGGRYTEPPF